MQKAIKLMILTMLIFFTMVSISYARCSNTYCIRLAIDTIGGAVGALDAIVCAGGECITGDPGIVIDKDVDQSMFYTYNASSAAAESDPTVIQPDDVAGNGRWILKSISDSALTSYLLADGTRALAGAWDMGSQALTNVNIDSGVITGITDLAVADGGTGASTAGDARTNLGLIIGTDVQAWDADLDSIAALSSADSNFIVGSAGGWVAENGATARTSLGLGSIATETETNYLLAAGSRALSGAWDAGSFEIRAETFESDVATGTAPFTIASTTVVANLNADQVDGKDETAFTLADGTRAFTGNQSFGDFNVTNVGEIDLDLIRADAANGSVTVELDNAAGADLLVGNNNTFVVAGDTDNIGIGTNTPDANSVVHIQKQETQIRIDSLSTKSASILVDNDGAINMMSNAYFDGLATWTQYDNSRHSGLILLDSIGNFGYYYSAAGVAPAFPSAGLVYFTGATGDVKIAVDATSTATLGKLHVMGDNTDWNIYGEASDGGQMYGIYETAGGAAQLQLMDASSVVYLDASPYQLNISSPSGSNPFFSLEDGDVSQPVTDLATATTIATIQPAWSTDGGMVFRGYTDADKQPIYFQGFIGSASPSVPAVVFQGFKSDGGTGFAALATTDPLADFGPGALTIAANGNTVVTGTLTVNGNQGGATDHVFDEYDDIELLRVWRRGEELPFAKGDMLNRDRLLRDAIVQQQGVIDKLIERITVLENKHTHIYLYLFICLIILLIIDRKRKKTGEQKGKVNGR